MIGANATHGESLENPRRLGAELDQLAPRLALLDRQSEERQRPLGDDRDRHAEQCQRAHRNHHVGQQFAHDDPPVGRPQRAGGDHELALAELDRGGPRQATDRCDRQQAERGGDREQAAVDDVMMRIASTSAGNDSSTTNTNDTMRSHQPRK